MYLRLKSAGIFYKVLNTPERIDIIEKMGHLERAMRSSFKSRYLLSRDRPRVARLLRTCRRTSAEFACSSGDADRSCQPLDAGTPARRASSQELAKIQTRTREYFRRLFG